MFCTECSGKIENHQKTEMLERGEWRATEAKEGEKKDFIFQVFIAQLVGIVGNKQ